MTAFPMRFHPAVARVHRLVSEGDLGRLRAFTGSNQSVMPLLERSWFADQRLAGGGAMMDHIVHLADAFCWIAASAPASVYAVGNRIVHADVVTVETGGLVMMTFPDGSFASMDCSWSRPLSYPTFGEARFSVVGDLGTVEVDALSQRLTQFGGSQAVRMGAVGSEPQPGDDRRVPGRHPRATAPGDHRNRRIDRHAGRGGGDGIRPVRPARSARAARCYGTVITVSPRGKRAPA